MIWKVRPVQQVLELKKGGAGTRRRGGLEFSKHPTSITNSRKQAKGGIRLVKPEQLAAIQADPFLDCAEVAPAKASKAKDGRGGGESRNGDGGGAEA